MSDYDSSEDEYGLPASTGSPMWDSDEALQNLKMERSVRGDETNETMTRRLLEEAAPMAAQRIIHLALHSPNDNTSLKAASYITDKLLDPDSNSGAKQKWETLVGEMVKQAELHSNSTP